LRGLQLSNGLASDSRKAEVNASDWARQWPRSLMLPPIAALDILNAPDQTHRTRLMCAAAAAVSGSPQVAERSLTSRLKAMSAALDATLSVRLGKW
jgi:hypothetical protein